MTGVQTCALPILDVNDIGNGVNASQYKQNIQTMISKYRVASNKPSAPVLLITGYPAPEPEIYYTEYPQALKEIALSDANIAWINGLEIYSDRALIDPNNATDVHLTNGADALTFSQRVGGAITSYVNSTTLDRKCKIPSTSDSE